MGSIIENPLAPQSRVGDFWYANASDAMKAEVQHLSMLPWQARTFSQMQEAADRASGNCTVSETNVFRTFMSGDIIQFGLNLQERVTDLLGTPDGALLMIRRPMAFEIVGNDGTILSLDSGVLADERVLGLPVSFPSPDVPTIVSVDQASLTPGYVLMVPYGFTPRAVYNSTGAMLMLGIDYTGGDGYLKFRQDPLVLFPGNTILCASVDVRKQNLFSFTLQANDLYTDGRYIVNYYRCKQTIPTLEKAAAEAAGLTIADIAGPVLEKSAYGSQGVRYILETGKLDVPYPHTELAVGDVVTVGDILGDVFNLYSKADGVGWYKQALAAGLCLDGLCPVRGVTVPNLPLKVTAWGQDPSGKLHIQMPFLGTSDAVTAYWNFVAANETRTGIYWNDVIGLPSIYSSTTINPLDFLFQVRLNSRAFVVSINQTAIDSTRTTALLQFIQREKPLGSIQINHIF